MKLRACCEVCVWSTVAFHSKSLAGVDDLNVAIETSYFSLFKTTSTVPMHVTHPRGGRMV